MKRTKVSSYGQSFKEEMTEKCKEIFSPTRRLDGRILVSTQKIPILK